jgi:diguanylate cyclase (GGDEF)-like protein
MTVPLAVIAAAVIWFSSTHTTRVDGTHLPLISPLPAVLLYLVFFGVAESLNLNIEVRRHGIRMSLTDIPLLLALFYLSPLSVLIVRFIAVLVNQIIHKMSLVKLAFNVAMISCATAIATLVATGWHRGDISSPTTWLWLFVAVTIGMTVTVVCILAVIWLVQRPMTPRELTQAGTPSVIVGSVNAVVGLVVLLVIQVSPWAIVLLAVVAAAMALVYRAYARFLKQNKSMTEMYDLTRVISDNPYDGTFADVLLRRVRELLHAEYATLWLPASTRYPETLLSARADDRGLLDTSATPERLRQLAVADGKTIAASAKLGDSDMRRELRKVGTKDAIIVPLRSGGAVIGSLEVSGRMHDDEHFTTDDVRLLETLAAHASVSVENARLVDRLMFDAEHDTLTGLPNRRRMIRALEAAVRVRAPGEVVATMVFDVDGIRDVNDSLGHAAGDKLLVEFAERLRALCPPAALVGRVGGDGFAVTIRIEDAEAAVALATELRDALQSPMEIGSLSLDVDAAVGVAVHPDHGSDPATLLQRADLATHAAKNLTMPVQLFNPSLESRSARRLGLAADLRRALDGNTLSVYFQPKVSLHNRELVGVECLAQWDHPVHGVVAPEDFVAVAAHTGQLGRLIDFILREGLRRARDWALAGRPMPISVNLSTRTIVDQDFPERVAALLAEFDVPPEMLTLEISERGVGGGDKDRPSPMLHRLDALGVRLSVDEFGTGESSLSYLRSLPVDEVKIDRSFVQGMATDPDDLAIVRAIVDLARHFDLDVVADGVENELTLSLLADIGCDIGQGFLFSRPLPYDRLEAWLGARTDLELTAAGQVRRLRAV